MSKNGLSFLVGLAAGVAIGVLTAPRAGAQTRDQITEKIRDIAEEATSRASDYADEFRHGSAESTAGSDRTAETAALAGDPGSEGY